MLPKGGNEETTSKENQHCWFKISKGIKSTLQRNIRSPHDAYKLMKHFLGDLDPEAFNVISLDVKNSPLTINICHVGSLNASIVHPREVMKSAILSNAASIMVGHNHPSGNSFQSIYDSKRLRD